MPNQYPTLRVNEIVASLSNQVISNQTFADNITHTYAGLIDMNRVDGTLFGDVFNVISTDVLKSVEWGNDAEAENLLKLARAQDPEVQSIYLDKFRQIALTLDQYLSKRAWGVEGAFAEFQNVLQTWEGDTKKIHETSLFNAFVGTDETNIGKQTQTLTLDAGTTEEGRRLRASQISEALADIYDDVADYSREYNDNGNLRAFGPENLLIVWNNKYLNQIQKRDLPTVFNDEALKANIQGYKLPARYFGTILTTGSTAGASNTTIRSLVEKDYNPENTAMNTAAYDETLHIFPGDLIPSGKQYKANEAYTENPKVICKIMYRRSVPFMTSMTVATDFFNPKSLTDTIYLTFGYNTLQHLKNYPMITIKEA